MLSLTRVVSAHFSLARAEISRAGRAGAGRGQSAGRDRTRENRLFVVTLRDVTVYSACGQPSRNVIAIHGLLAIYL